MEGKRGSECLLKSVSNIDFNPVSQLSVVLSTLGGMVFLHERKSKRELVLTLSGLVLIVIGAVVTTLI